MHDHTDASPRPDDRWRRLPLYHVASHERVAWVAHPGPEVIIAGEWAEFLGLGPDDSLPVVRPAQRLVFVRRE
ncbi:MAG: hypothetical protein ACOCYN_04775 [Planctomycetota bacterium]